jgi:arsenate reductase
MGKLKFYGYKRCGTCRKAEKDLENKGLNYEFFDITQTPPKLKELKAMIEQSGLELSKFYNTSGIKYKELNIKDKRKELSQAEQIKLLASDGYLLKRPLVTDGKSTTVGFKQENYDEVWKA